LSARSGYHLTEHGLKNFLPTEATLANLDMTATGETPRRRGRPPSGGREAILEATLAILREHGIANLTSREVAARAGVSDASVYYHFGDRAGLLQAVFEHGMKPLKFMFGLEPETMDPPTVLRGAFDSLERFFDDVLPVLHKGVQMLGAYLRAEQAAGRVNPDADPDAIALLVIDAAFGRAAWRQMLLKNSKEQLPSNDAVLSEISRLLG
jgi:AcrR family transcriptional regulator